MPTKRTKPLRQRLVHALDKVTGDIVKYRDGYQCYCGSRINPSQGHLIGRSNYAVRWHLLNNHCQCSACNGGHQNPALAYRYVNWFIIRFGARVYTELNLLADTRTADEWTTAELKDELERKQEVWLRMTTLAVFDDKRLFEIGAWGDDIQLDFPLGPERYSWRLLNAKKQDFE